MKELQAAGRGKQQPISFNHWSSGRRVRKTSCVSVCEREPGGGALIFRGFYQARAQNMMTVFITLRQVRSGGGARVWGRGQGLGCVNYVSQRARCCVASNLPFPSDDSGHSAAASDDR